MITAIRHRYDLPSKGKMALILAAVLFVITTIAVIIFLFSHGLSTIAESQLTAIRDHDLQKAYAMTTNAFKNQTSFEIFKEYINAYPVLSDNKSVDFNEVKIEEDFGYLSGIITAKNGNTMQIEYQFIRENGKWRIQAIRLSPEDD